jgi:hypothetical protein
MRTITLRNLPRELERLLEENAAASDSSLNKTVIRLLEKALGIGKPSPGKRRYHDLDELAGSWSPEEAREFDRQLEEQRQIDPGLWD